VECHPPARIFRDCDLALLQQEIPGSQFRGSEAHGKQMLFRFSRGFLWLHLGMTGELRTEESDFHPGRHDHLVLRLKRQALVFRDPRLFGGVRFFRSLPGFWKELPVAVVAAEFDGKRLQLILQRAGKCPLKALLLRQEFFPGIGNWMADEILWRSRLHPAGRGCEISPRQAARLLREIKFVAQEALRIIAPDWSDPPQSWLFPHRWKDGGVCPRCRGGLWREAIGGRTTCWCPACQCAS
jgi:formamidopyrimidine-DNA glycosylase